MKIWVVLMIFLLPGVMAVSTDLGESYQPAQTAIFQIQGNILEPILREDIKFLREGHIEVPFDYDVKKIGENYFIYAVMPFLYLEENESREYTFLIENLKTTELGKNVEIDFEKNFSVVGEIYPYSLTPGLIISSDNFNLDVTLNRDFNEVIMVDFPSERGVVLKPGNNKIFFDVSSVSGGIYGINVGDYLVQVSLVKEVIAPPQVLIFDPFEINSVLLIDSDEVFRFKIINTGEENIEEYTFDYNVDLFDISPEFPSVLEAGKVYQFNLILKENNGDIEEFIYLNYGEEQFSFPVYVSYTVVEEDVIIPDEGVSQVGYYCAELNGENCGIDSCSGEVVESRDFTECCLASCSTPGKTSYAWVGYLVGMVLVIGLFFIGVKYFRSKRQKDTFKTRVKKAENKVMPTF